MNSPKKSARHWKEQNPLRSKQSVMSCVPLAIPNSWIFGKRITHHRSNAPNRRHSFTREGPLHEEHPPGSSGTQSSNGLKVGGTTQFSRCLPGSANYRYSVTRSQTNCLRSPTSTRMTISRSRFAGQCLKAKLTPTAMSVRSCDNFGRSASPPRVYATPSWTITVRTSNGRPGQEKNLLISGELEEYEDRLEDEWSRYRDVVFEKLDEKSAETVLREAGQKLYQWADLESGNISALRIRERVTEPYVVRGCFHILANINPLPRVYWHPLFLKRLSEVLAVGA